MGKDYRVGEILIEPDTLMGATEVAKAIAAGVTHATVNRYDFYMNILLL